MIFSGVMGCSLNINKWHNPYFQWQNSENQRESLQSPSPLGTQTLYHQILCILSTKSDSFSLEQSLSNVVSKPAMLISPGNWLENPQVPTKDY